ncbi:uncharacterized protein LOC118445672 [Vespa mandarinia]|uniref:uncharacterized protein LOC118445672 n=1 Tax=Vespa mandarinia TaxID=7446 RepID=UPI00161CB173|nr:uncharacterized protein LOC118445672 [Vespa mandarinia]
MLDNKLNYREHIIKAANKAAKVVAPLGTLMANVNGPRPCMRRLLMRAAEAVMLYGAEVWAEAQRKEKYPKERQFVDQQKAVLGKEEASKNARSNSIEAWQSRWEQEPRSTWTARHISRLDNWINREAGDVDFYLTQFLTGHGLFCSYLAKMRKVANGNCPYGDSINDDDHHTFFICTRWSAERFALEQDLGDISPAVFPACRKRRLKETV